MEEGKHVDAPSPRGGGKAVPLHFWEHRVLGYREPGEPSQAQDVTLSPFGAPLLVAAARGRLPSGERFEWLARRHRKHLRLRHEEPSPPPVLWWDWLRAGRYQRQGVDVATHWWVAALYFIGSVLFVLAGVGGVIHSVVLSAAGATSLSFWIVSLPSALAANFCFWPAGYLQLLEALNMNFAQRREAWEKGGRAGPEPRRRLIGADLDSISWWGAVIQWVGMTFFNAATISALVGNLVTESQAVELWLTALGFTLGGAFFAFSGVLFCIEGSGSLWRGLVPSRRKDLASFSWEAAWWNLLGAVGFTIGGAAMFLSSRPWGVQLPALAVGNLGGAVAFLVSAWLLFLELSNPSEI